MSRYVYKLLLKARRSQKIKLDLNIGLPLAKANLLFSETLPPDSCGFCKPTGFFSITENGMDYIENYRHKKHTLIIAWFGAITGGIALLMSILNTLRILEIL